MSLNIKPIEIDAVRIDRPRPLAPIALGTALVLISYVTPMATVTITATDLGAGAIARAWILSSMSVGLAGALLAAGVLGDRVGRRRTYVAGLAALGVGALICAVAPSSAVFIAARMLEGVGGAAILACGLAALAHHYSPGSTRMRATSVWGASVGLGIGLGGVLAATLNSGSGWRETYAITGVVAGLLIAPSRRWIGESSAAAPRGVDVFGLALLVAALVLAVAALTQGRSGLSVSTVGLGVLALVALAAFVLVERRVAEPLIEPELLGHPRFRAATAGSFVLGAGMIGMASFTPLLMQVGFGRGLWVAIVPVVSWAGTSVATALLVLRIPYPLEGPRPVALFLVMVAFGQLLGWHLSLDSGLWRLVVFSVVAGLGTGVLNSLLGREAIASVPPDRAAMGSGANNTARYLGAAIGITLFVTVATYTGKSLVDGWNHATLVAAAVTLLGAALIALTGRT